MHGTFALNMRKVRIPSLQHISIAKEPSTLIYQLRIDAASGRSAKTGAIPRLLHNCIAHTQRRSSVSATAHATFAALATFAFHAAFPLLQETIVPCPLPILGAHIVLKKLSDFTNQSYDYPLAALASSKIRVTMPMCAITSDQVT